MQRHKVLVLDKEQGYISTLANLLAQDQCQVLHAHDGLLADKILARHQVDLLVIAAELGDDDGIQWLEAYREQNTQTPALFLAEHWHSRDEWNHLIHTLGVAHILQKPVTPSVLSVQITQLLDEKPENEERAHAQEILATMRGNYAEKLLARIEELERLLHVSWAEGVEALDAALQLAHKLKGTAGTYGYTITSIAATEIEESLAQWRQLGQHPDWTALARACQRATREVRKRLLVRELPASDEPKRTGHILVVDDDRVFLSMVSEILGRQGYRVSVTPDPKNLVTMLEATRPDLLLMDVELGDHSGFALCRELRSMNQWQWLPILFLTAHNDAQTRLEAFQTGGDDFITKPIIGEELSARIEVRLDREHLLKEHKAAMERLERSHESLYAILQQLQLGVMITDPEGAVRFVSESCRALLGLESVAILGESWTKALPFTREDMARIEALLDQERGKRKRLQLDVTTGEKSHRLEVELRNDPRHKGGKIFYFHDISELFNLRQQLKERFNRQIVGQSEPMKRLFHSIQQLSRGDWTVLIEGETGVGKELVARAVHDTSPRKTAPFLAVNCAGLSESLLASQLFGHRRGAFTGAINDQVGLFQAADGGTLFLDEIGDIPLGVQVSLLRVLQEGEITPLGEVKPRKVNVRIIAATNKTLSEEVKTGAFREDLFYRLQVGRLKVPPLRERKGDIPILVAHFIESGRSRGGTITEMSAEAMARMLEYDWPGNVRELENAVQFAAIHALESLVRLEDLPPELMVDHQKRMNPIVETAPQTAYPREGTMTSAWGTSDGQIPLTHGRLDRDLERRLMIDALHRANGNRTKAAQILGIARATLYRRLAEFDL